jgi:branched-chain amino acid transport system permease protein
MIWLCQITFAGGGGLIAAKLWTDSGVDPIVAALIGAALMVPIGVLIGSLTIRLGDLYVALVTLSFGLLVDQVVFSQTRFMPAMGGVPFARPSFAQSDYAFAYFALGVFLIVAAVLVNLRRSTSGLAVNAIRWSQPASRTLGIKVIRMKLVLSGIAAFVAGLGGAVLSMYDLSNDPSTYGTFNGLVWLAVLVSIGIRSVTAALLAGVCYTLLPAVFQTHLTGDIWLQVPALLFGLGAILLAKNPEGAVAMNARALESMIFGKLFRRSASEDAAFVGDLDTDEVFAAAHRADDVEVGAAVAVTEFGNVEVSQ